MKLFYYDRKHELIHDQLNLGDLSIKEQELIEKIISFLKKTGITDGRYKDLILDDNLVINPHDEE